MMEDGFSYCYIRIAEGGETLASEWKIIKLPSGDNEFNIDDIP